MANAKALTKTPEATTGTAPNDSIFSDAEKVNSYSVDDTAYMEAVERGDMETAQRMVDEAARAAMPKTKILDEEGKLLTVYHGTSEKFTVFDKAKGRANMDIQGSFFSPWELDAQGYGENVGAYYLNIVHPTKYIAS